MASRLPRNPLGPTVDRQLPTMDHNPRDRLECMESQLRRSLMDPTADPCPKAVELTVGQDYPTVLHPPARVTNPPWPVVFQ